MERRIHWVSGCHDEIELVYEKAEQNDSIGALLSELEQMALLEAENSCGILSLDGKPVSREMVLGMSERDKEAVMYYLSAAGLDKFNPSLTEPKIIVVFSPRIQMVLGCTMFSLLNRIEKIDGSYNVLGFPKATLELHIPLGGRKGMTKWELLIMQLYPWLSVREVSYNVAADGLLENNAPKEPTVSSQPASNAEAQKTPSKEKKGFFSKLFGK